MPQALCTGTFVMSIFILISVIIIHLLFQNGYERFTFRLNTKYMDDADAPYTDLKKYIRSDEDYMFLKRKLKAFNISNVMDPDFFKNHPDISEIVKDNKNLFYEYDTLTDDCELQQASLLTNVFKVRMIDPSKVLPERKCVIRIEKSSINQDSIDEFVMVMRNTDVGSNILSESS